MWLLACSFWKVVVCCDDAMICPMKKNRFSTCCLGYAAVHFCQQFIVTLQIGVWRQLSTLQQIFSPQQTSRAPRRLWLLSTAYVFSGSFTERTSTYPSLASHFPWEPQHQAAAAGSRAANIVVTDVLGRHTCTWWISTWPSVSCRGINNTANSILHVYYSPACGGRGEFMCRVWYINPD